jgi:uncharacterized OB-fold protein
MVFPPRNVCPDCATATQATIFSEFSPRAAALVRVQVVRTVTA